MVYRYVPILRCKRGERTGLSHLRAASRIDVVPLFIATTEQYTGIDATSKRPAVSQADRLVQELQFAWGTAPFYLDVSSLPQTAAGHHPLMDIGASARAAGLSLIPVVRSGTPQYMQAVAALIAQDQRGVGLLVDLQLMTSAATWIAQWPHQLNITDLIVDLAGNVATVSGLGNVVDQAFINLHSGAQWRSVTVCGTSLPDNFSGFQAGLHLIQRVEVSLWQRLTQAQLPYRLDYGDYATVPINTPPAGIKWGYPINVKYTIANDFLVCRGVSTTGLGGIDMDQQLVSHARTISGYPNRNPLAGCWADARIDGIAITGTDQSNLEGWVKIGVNRHIELTRTILP